MPSARRKSLKKLLSTPQPTQAVPWLSRAASDRRQAGSEPCKLYIRPSQRRSNLRHTDLQASPVAPLKAKHNSMTFNSDKHLLIGKMEEYNRRIQLPTFHIKGNFTTDKCIEYEGALRFFLAHGENNFTKAVRLTSSDTWKDLKPQLHEKFNLEDGVKSGKLVPILYAVKEAGELAVKDDDCPLVMALDSGAHIQFILRVYQEDGGTGNEQKNKSSGQFFKAVKKRLSKANLKGDEISSNGSSDTLSRDPVAPNPDRKKRGEDNFSSHGSTASRKTSAASRQSSNQSSNGKGSSLTQSAAAMAKSMDNLAKSSKSSKRRAKGSNGTSMSNMLAIDDTEEFVTVHGERNDLGVDEVVIPIDGSMTVRDIIADVLEECDISLGRVDDFTLCDVIGRETEGIWLTDYARDMNDSEKPLLLISMMKPSEGLSRRFELKLIHKDEDCLSHGNSAISDHDMFTMRQYKRPTSTSIDSSISNITDYQTQTMKFPSDVPYFLTVQSYDAQNDSVLYLVDRTTSILGSSDNEDQCNIRLHAPDVLPQHCWICKVYSSENENIYKCVSLAPFTGAAVRINEQEIKSKTNLKPGDVVTIGKHYVFMFKDPLYSGHKKVHSSHSNTLSDKHDQKFSQHTNWDDGMSLHFCPEKRDTLITKIITIMSPLEEGFKLTPAYLYALMIDFGSQSMSHKDLATLVIKISSELHTVVWDSTKTLQANAECISSSNPIDSLHAIWPNLQLVIFWMSNCVELRSFVMNKSAQQGQELDENGINEACNTLSEATTYAFQQAVYHLTKVLYPTLNTILFDNPFTRDSTGEKVSISDTLQTLTMIRNLCQTMSLNDEITSQLFSYLYFFIGTSLCNKLFESESVPLYYNWEEGVKIRKNLESLENWALDNQSDVAVQYLGKVVSVADFLATSKQFLLQASWHQLRNIYPKLSPPQLRHLLENYDLGSRQVPAHWCPPSEEIYSIMNSGVMESFEDHPPLNMPAKNCIDISVKVHDPTFQQYLEYLNSMFGSQQQSEDETDSGFDLGHSRSPTEVEENGRAFSDTLKSESRESDSDAPKSYTPIFKKKKDSAPKVKRLPLSASSSLADDNPPLRPLSIGSSADEGELCSNMGNITITSEQV